MKLTDRIDVNDIINVNEVFDTKIPVENWIKKGNSIIGNMFIENEQFHVIIELQHYNFNNKQFNFLNIAFAKILENGEPTQLLSLTNKNSSKILGVIYNALSSKIKELSNKLDIKAITFVARDNVDKRMSLYNRMTSNLFNPFTSYKQNIPLSNGAKMTILFSGYLDSLDYDSFIKYVDSLLPNP